MSDLSPTTSAQAMDGSPEPPPGIKESNARVYGHIPGVPVGKTFETRKQLMDAGVHGLIRAGIHGNSSPNGGAFSICMSGGYDDDEDFGDRIIYVGSGGQDPDRSGKQVANQSFEDPGNKSLCISCQNKKPVRLIRGGDSHSIYGPSKGYRYDGLYVVDSYTMKKGKHGYFMCFFELSRIVEEGIGLVPRRSPSTD